LTRLKGMRENMSDRVLPVPSPRFCPRRRLNFSGVPQ
jgi:hypothetical protein